MSDKLLNNYCFSKTIIIQKFYQNPKLTALSIGKHAPIPSQTATKKPKMKVKLAIGRRNGF